MDEKSDLMEKIISLCKRRGFIYPGSEIYGGLAGTYDYGPLGVALKNNIKMNYNINIPIFLIICSECSGKII